MTTRVTLASTKRKHYVGFSYRHSWPVLKIAVKAPDMRRGDILEVLGDCPTFEKDLRIWCDRLGKVFLSVRDEGQESKRVQIQF
jgi:tRNA 2-thiouridine synthesizing protein A